MKKRVCGCSQYLDTKSCIICGKQFGCITSVYVYKRSAKYFCSYTCMRKYDTEKYDMQAEQQKKRIELNRELARRRKEKNELRINNC